MGHWNDVRLSRVRPLVVSCVAVLFLFGCAECGSSDGTPPLTAVSRASRPVFSPAAFMRELTAVSVRMPGPILADARFLPEERSAARRIIAAQLREFGLSPVEQRYVWGETVSQCAPESYVAACGAYGINLFADLQATVPTDRWIVVGAHYDTVQFSPGADDNASGVAVTLAVADALTRLPTRNVNVVFAFFDQEEEGLLGSARLAQWLLAHGRTVLAANIIDMVSWDGDGDYVAELIQVGGDETWQECGWLIDTYVRAAAEMRANCGTQLDGPRPIVLNVARSNSCRSDHCSFLRLGIPAVQVAEEMIGGDHNPNYHGMTDTFDRVNMPYLWAVADLVVAAVREQVSR